MRRMAIAIATIALALASCGVNSTYPPVGSYSNVVIVTEAGRVEDAVTEAIVREIQHEMDYYTKTELQFRVRLVPALDFERQRPTKNMVICGVVRDGDVGRIIESFIGTTGVRRVLEGKDRVFRKMDYPVKGQYTIIVTASSRETLLETIRENGATVRDLIEYGNRLRLRDFLLDREREDLEEELAAKYGFSLRIPELYELNQERPEVPGFEFVRTPPHRGLTVSWEPWDGRGLSLADSSLLYEARERLAWAMYDRDVMRREMVRFDEEALGDYEAVAMRGYWENSEDLYGGPFLCFFVLDRVASRLWIVDCVVYAPTFDKHTFIRELHAVAETFSIR
ncbi:MAG: DUF4837 family protein [Candidatus Krumholzibacteriota bacterium]|nr:DUF4837 family protein [Candidatus Krumholzibacteriota bacterium]